MIKKYTPLFYSRKQVIKEGYLRLFPDKTTPIPSPVLPQDPHGLCAQNPDGLFLFCFFFLLSYSVLINVLPIAIA